VLLDRLPRFPEMAQHRRPARHSVLKTQRFARLWLGNRHCLDWAFGCWNKPREQLRPEVIFGQIPALPQGHVQAQR
jgi:hypothetical protein